MCITTALIPSYCPDERLVHLVNELEDHNIHCVCVNDGSTEEYDGVFAKLPESAVILKHETNRGKGAALKTGMQYIYDHIRDGVIVSADSDGQHLLHDIMKTAEAAKERPDALILGVRSFARKEVPARSYYGNKITEGIFTLLTGVHIHDTQTGLRAFHSSMIPGFLKIRGERYEYEMNQLLDCISHQTEIVQIPIQTVYEGNNEVSHFHAFRDSVRICSRLLKFSFGSLASFALDTSLFALFDPLFRFGGGMAAANVLARVCSASFNYEFNRQAVFHDESSRKSSLMKYVSLAAFILLCNTCILYLLNRAGIRALYAKILSEMILFLFSFVIQNRFVFQHTERKVSI